MPDLEGKVALVTGCGSSSGIGYATALRMAHDGADVAIHGRPNAEDATRELGSMVAGFGRRALRVTGDLRKEADVVKIVDTTFDHFGRIDILVNAAALTGPLKSSIDLTDADWEDALAVNVRGVFLACREAGRVMSGQGVGAIINIVSGSTPAVLADSIIYLTTKGAVAAMTKALAAELLPKGIRVNAVAPGLVESPIGTQLRRQADKKRGAAARASDRSPLSSEDGMPEDIAGAIAFLASEDAAQISGQVINLSASR